jgi:serine protease Do
VRLKVYALSVALLAGVALAPAQADDSAAKVADEVNPKLVKVFGSGGIKGLPSYGTGILVSADGYFLTAASPLLDTRDLRVHLSDGRRYHCKMIVMEPELDIALAKIDSKDKLDDLQFYDVLALAKKPNADAGTGVLAFSNEFQIATRDEPMSVMRGRVAAFTKLQARRGTFSAAYKGNVYVVDAITNNPGAAGGALTTRSGELLGIIGKELQNELTNTWINYAIPLNAAVEVTEDEGKKRTISIVEILEKKEAYNPPKKTLTTKEENFTGIILVPDVVEFTPPYVEELMTGSPGEKAGLQPDDLIVYIQGEQVNNIKVYKEIMSKIRPGEKIALEVRRGDKLQTLSLTVAEPLKKPKK